MATTARGIVYPTVGTTLTPLSNHFASLATSTDTALDNLANTSARMIGTDAARTALTAPSLKEGLRWYSTDTNREWLYDGSNWLSASAGSYLIYPSSVSAGTITGGHVNVTSGNTVTVNGVFSSRFRAYKIVMDADVAALSGFNFWLTAGGTPSTTGYYTQFIYSTGAAVAGAYSAGGTALALQTYGGLSHQHEFMLSRPGHALSTYITTIDNVPTAGAWNTFGYHNQTTAYDGFRITATLSNFTSSDIAVYGLA